MNRLQLPKAVLMPLGLLLALAEPAHSQLKVVNGDFGDLSGLRPENDGWYAGLPKGWSGTGNDYAVNHLQDTELTICNPSRVTNLHQQVGSLQEPSDVVLTFDVSDVFNGQTLLKASILDGNRKQLASGQFTDGTKRTLVAKRVPAGTTIVILFEASRSTPGLGNVSIKAVKPRFHPSTGSKMNEPITVAAYYYPGTHPDPRWDKNKYPGFTEWDEIKAAKPRFPGHFQPNPLCGAIKTKPSLV